MIATLIAVIVANADNVCFSIMIPSPIATSVLEIAYHSKKLMIGAGAVLLDSSLIPSPPIMPQDRARVDGP